MNLIKKRDITPNFFNTHFNIPKKNLLVNIQNKINPNKIHLKDFHFIYDNEKYYVYGDYTKNKSNQYKIRQSNVSKQNVNYYFKNMLYIENLIASKLNSRTISNTYLNTYTYPNFNLKLFKVNTIENDFFNVIGKDLIFKCPSGISDTIDIDGHCNYVKNPTTSGSHFSTNFPTYIIIAVISVIVIFLTIFFILKITKSKKSVKSK